MEKFKQYKYLILIVLVILSFIFYWFQIRPAKIKSACIKLAQQGVNIAKENNGSFNSKVDEYRALNGYITNQRIDELYSICLKTKGL